MLITWIMRCSSSGQDFTVLLKQTVEAKRLSGGKVQEIVQTGVKFLKVGFSSLINLSHPIRLHTDVLISTCNLLPVLLHLRTTSPS